MAIPWSIEHPGKLTGLPRQCAHWLAMTAVVGGWSFYFGMVVIAAERAIPESPLRGPLLLTGPAPLGRRAIIDRPYGGVQNTGPRADFPSVYTIWK